jgi:hypothetical protein
LLLSRDLAHIAVCYMTLRGAPNEGMVVSVMSGKETERKGQVLDEFGKSNEKKKKKKHRH